jgi:hypothetical protein
VAKPKPGLLFISLVRYVLTNEKKMVRPTFNVATQTL